MVSLLVTDSSGNSSSCNAIVTVVDNSAPIIGAMQDLEYNYNPAYCGALVNYNLNVFDNCSATLVQTSGFASGVSFPIGTTTNTFYCY